MRFVMFYHSLVSDWNHGNAHFLRGVVTELVERGHDVEVFEPVDSWSRANLAAESPGAEALFEAAYPGLSSSAYSLDDLDLDEALEGADVVIVHEWNDHELVRRAGKARAAGRFRLFFHDTHHRSVTEPWNMAAFDLTDYDGVLAFGQSVRDVYLRRGWAAKAWTWHEAADTRVFRPMEADPAGDLVWVGNWGDGERCAEIEEYILGPARSLGLRARMHGVRYPEAALSLLSSAGAEYGGWVPNFEVPRIFASFKCTVHVPRRPYAKALPGVPTIRVFEALACGLPLVSSPWEDTEQLFSPGRDFLVARSGTEMKRHLASLVNDEAMREELGRAGLETVLARHTCAHRADELIAILGELNGGMATI